jgi:hypothetical protein
MLNMSLELMQASVEWMSRPILIGRFHQPRIDIEDEWSVAMDPDGITVFI